VELRPVSHSSIDDGPGALAAPSGMAADPKNFPR
jgi:hypothetical protein